MDHCWISGWKALSILVEGDSYWNRSIRERWLSDWNEQMHAEQASQGPTRLGLCYPKLEQTPFSSKEPKTIAARDLRWKGYLRERGLEFARREEKMKTDRWAVHIYRRQFENRYCRSIVAVSLRWSHSSTVHWARIPCDICILERREVDQRCSVKCSEREREKVILLINARTRNQACCN